MSNQNLQRLQKRNPASTEVYSPLNRAVESTIFPESEDFVPVCRGVGVL